jgi:SAM-dependent methyltransferase
MPTESDLASAYAHYYTHDVGPPKHYGLFKRRLSTVYKKAREGYLAARHNIKDGTSAPIWRWMGLTLALAPSLREDFEFQVLYTSPLQGGHALDVGCGAGQEMLRLAGRGWIVKGLDPDLSAVEAARSRGLEVSHGTLSDGHFPDGYFDLVLMSHVLEHLRDIGAAVAEVHRILKPGGRLVALTPNGRSWGHRTFGRHWRGLETPRHLYVYSPSHLITIAQTCGFADVSVRSSVRGARRIIAESFAIRRFERGTRPGARRRDMWAAFLLQAWEGIRLQLDKASGEELVLIARRPGDPTARRLPNSNSLSSSKPGDET